MLVKFFEWNKEKNIKLKVERGVSFEDVIVAIQEGKLITIVNHPNQKQYPDQKMFVVELNEYAYVVPFVEKDQTVFLKTIFPSRKYTSEYIERR